MALQPAARLCLKQALPHLAVVVAMIRALISSEETLSPGLRRRIVALLRPAEALARRLLILLAKQPAIRAARQGRPLPDWSCLPKPGRKAAPSFRLSEPLVTFAVLLQRQKAKGPNLLHWHRPAPNTFVKTDQQDRLLKRLAALEAVSSNPQRAARRMARWLVRHARQPGRTSPLRIGYPPGLSDRPPDARLDCLLRDAQMFARSALDPPPGETACP
ncbi:hypothetical protein [Henriciella sp.]|uniref:hypothetical protein n=1 Tax=Henriciella sp. TaxID=1968823 RepID=UPI00261C251E|nr:hypothetical protein [Henriciella sp.]